MILVNIYSAWAAINDAARSSTYLRRTDTMRDKHAIHPQCAINTLYTLAKSLLRPAYTDALLKAKSVYFLVIQGCHSTTGQYFTRRFII